MIYENLEEVKSFFGDGIAARRIYLEADIDF